VTGYYEWRGDPAKSEAARQEGRDRQASRAGGSARGAANSRDRSVRFRRYCALRDGGVSREDARKDPGVNVAADTERKYNRARTVELESAP
jgi:hypothetical protein